MAADPNQNTIETELETQMGAESNNNNISTNNTGNRTQDNEESSSIEALNWSEFDEEEIVSALVANNTNSNDIKQGADPESKTESNGSSLSSSLLQSISSQMTEVDKVSKIENWASGVRSATERGEIESEREESGAASTSQKETTEVTGDIIGTNSMETDTTTMKLKDKGKESQDDQEMCMRKRNLKMNSMSMSTTSALSTTDTKEDSLSNAPVLDDGPIWAKGPKCYKFQENRRINQKLTFGVLLSVVLAIGLGLGNLVAYNECEAEYKSTVSTSTSSGASEGNTESETLSVPSVEPDMPESMINDNSVPVASQIPAIKPQVSEVPNVPVEPKSQKPMIDAKYASHAEALKQVVKSLDELSRKIDQFENTTRQLGGIVMLRDEVFKEASSKSIDKDGSKLDKTENDLLIEEKVYSDNEDKETIETLNGEDNFIDNLIDTIENPIEEDNNDIEFINNQFDSSKIIEQEAKDTEFLRKVFDVIKNLENDFREDRKDSKLQKDVKSSETGNVYSNAEIEELEHSWGQYSKKYMNNFELGEESGKSFVKKQGQKQSEEIPKEYKKLETKIYKRTNDQKKKYKYGNDHTRTKSHSGEEINKRKNWKNYKSHERRKIFSGENPTVKYTGQQIGKNLNSDWVSERAKVREQNRKNYHNEDTFWGKKIKNWQIERDRVREKVRNKNMNKDN